MTNPPDDGPQLVPPAKSSSGELLALLALVLGAVAPILKALRKKK